MRNPHILSGARSAAANYKRLAPFIASVDEQENRHFTFHSGGYMPLSIEYLPYTWEGYPVYSMMHYYTQEGDLMRDPDMTFAVLHDEKKLVPLTFQQDGLPIKYGTLYQVVFPEPGKYRPGLLKDLDSFLSTWTRNIISQGFSPEEPSRPMTFEEFESKYAESR